MVPASLQTRRTEFLLIVATFGSRKWKNSAASCVYRGRFSLSGYVRGKRERERRTEK